MAKLHTDHTVKLPRVKYETLDLLCTFTGSRITGKVWNEMKNCDHHHPCPDGDVCVCVCVVAPPSQSGFGNSSMRRLANRQSSKTVGHSGSTRRVCMQMRRFK